MIRKLLLVTTLALATTGAAQADDFLSHITVAQMHLTIAKCADNLEMVDYERFYDARKHFFYDNQAAYNSAFKTFQTLANANPNYCDEVLDHPTLKKHFRAW